MGSRKISTLKLTQQTSAFLFSAQFCHNSRETVMACGGTQMKMFSVTDGSEML